MWEAGREFLGMPCHIKWFCKILFILEYFDSQKVAKIVQRSYIPFTQLPPRKTSYITTVHCENQKADVGCYHINSFFLLLSFVLEIESRGT